MATTKLPSAGLLLHRGTGARLEVLLAHMGGPFWARKDDAAWSIPKGEYEHGEDAFATARREFAEELGAPAPEVAWSELGSVRQAGGKVVTVWCGESDLDVTRIVSNTFTMEWPRHSGRMQTFPEVDRAAWFTPEDARRKLVAGQVVFVDRLVSLLATSTSAGPAPTG